MNNLKNILKKILVKTRIIDSFDIDGVSYKIVEQKSIIPRFKNQRSINFSVDGRDYTHSAIYMNPKEIFQPIFLHLQKVLELWSRSNEIGSALVLGCAGCSIPRFLAFSHPNIKITGVDLSKKFIEISHKYFLLNQIEKQFTLTEGDAIKFVKDKTVQSQDLIYVDIFAGNAAIKEVFSNEFLSCTYDIASENSLVIINAFGMNGKSLKEICENMNAPFQKKHLIKSGGSYYLCLIKNDRKSLEKFEKDIMNCENFSVVF